MEGVLERDETDAVRGLLPVPVASCKLQARLNRFGPAVAEKRPWKTGERRKPRSDFSLKRMKVQVGRVQQRRSLFGDRSGQARMGVSQRRDPDT
jgi:hypothetical protein